MLPYALLIIMLIPLLNYKGKSIRNKKFFLSLWCLTAIILAGVRGDFTADFYSYKNWFEYVRNLSLSDIKLLLNLDYHFNSMELGYVVINFAISRFTDNYMWLQIAVACITYIPICLWCKKSPDQVLSLLLFISVGFYLEGFNTVRNILAAAICTFSVKYVVKLEFKKYVLVVLCASFFHLSALIMLPVYFIIRWKLTIEKVLLYLCALFLGIVSMEKLAELYNKFFYVSSDSDLLDLLYRRQAGINSVIFPLILVAITIFLYYKSSDKNAISEELSYERILINGTLIWGLIKITMLYSGYTTRFAAYFSYFILLALPLELRKLDKNNRVLFSIILVILCSVYFLITAKSYGNYYTLF